MRTNYIPFVDRMIDKYEGGYCWTPGDRGGPTKYGITCYDYAEFQGKKMHSMAAWAPLVKAMTRAEAEQIYKKKYAIYVRFDELPGGIDVWCMDYGVNSGRGRPVHVLRKLLNVSGGDRMDDNLLAAIKAADTSDLIDRLYRERLQFMKSIRGGKDWAEFKGGWQARCDDLRAYAKRLTKPANVIATVPPPEAPDLSEVPTPKATHAPVDVGKTITNRITTIASTGLLAHWSEATGLPVWALVTAISVAVLAVVALAGWGVYRASRNDRIVGKIKATLQGYRTQIGCGALGLVGSVFALQDTLGIDVQGLITDHLPTQYVGIGAIVVAGFFSLMHHVSDKYATAEA
jgi:lysozyme family protein